MENRNVVREAPKGRLEYAREMLKKSVEEIPLTTSSLAPLPLL